MHPEIVISFGLLQTLFAISRGFPIISNIERLDLVVPIGPEHLLLPPKVLFVLHLNEVLAWIGVDAL